MPACVNVCDGFCEVLVGVPSPKFQLYDAHVPSASVQPPVNCTVSGLLPKVGVADGDAIGSWFASVMRMVFVSVAPMLFDTVNVTP